MEAAVLTLHQVILMMLLIAVGMVCARLKWFTDDVAQALSRFLLWFVTPALLINAFYRSYDAAEARGLLFSAHRNGCASLRRLPLSRKQCTDDGVPRHGLRLRLAHHPHDKHPVCYLNPHIIVSGRFAVMRIDKRSQSPYTVYHRMIYGR